jgi:protoheme IX farnesyltransferase
VILIPLGMLPWAWSMTGWVSLIIVALANLFMIVQCVRLYRDMDVKAARRVMFSSYIYLPVVLIALLGDKL